MSENLQVRDEGVPLSYHHGKAVSSLVDDCQTMHPPPADKDTICKKKTNRAARLKFYICADVSHTHPAVAGSFLSGRHARLEFQSRYIASIPAVWQVTLDLQSCLRFLFTLANSTKSIDERHIIQHLRSLLQFARCQSSPP